MKQVQYLTLLVFFKKTFKLQPNLCNRCHDLLMLSMNLSNIAILKNKGSDDCHIISGISKIEDINLIQNTNLIKKSGKL